MTAETFASVAMVDADVVVIAHFDIFLEHGPLKKTFSSFDEALVLYIDHICAAQFASW